MNKHLSVAVLLVLTAVSALAGEMGWVRDFEAARVKAGKARQLILIDFYVDGCGWCRKLEAGAWQDAQVGKLAERFVPVKLNLEKEGAALAKKYGVRSHPYLLFVDSKGEVWGHSGYVGPSEFLAAAGPAIELFSRMPKVEAALKKNPQDGPANCSMAQVMASRGLRDKALGYLNAALDGGFRGPELAKTMNGLGDCVQGAQDYDGAIEWFLKGRAASQNPADESYALISIVSCYLNKKDSEGAKKYARILIELKDGTPEYVEIAKGVLGGG